jgi:hypothetical protein
MGVLYSRGEMTDFPDVPFVNDRRKRPMSVTVHARTCAHNVDSLGFTPKIMVYEDVPVQHARWEYYILTIDTNERALPDAERLNELGNEGWLLNGVLPQAPAGGVALVHYYFVRQKLQ